LRADLMVSPKADRTAAQMVVNWDKPKAALMVVMRVVQKVGC
jgi:hypothetical protein